MPSHHFLDANVLIDSLVEWDGQHRCTYRYMQQEGFRRHTSKRVYAECAGSGGRFKRAAETPRSMFITERVYDLKRADLGEIVLVSGDQRTIMDHGGGCNDCIRKFHPIHSA